MRSSLLRFATSATAIYGQRGANGVVLITTKRGEKGKVKINVKTGFSWNTPVKVPEYANAYDWASLANEALEGRYESPLYTSEEMNIIRYGLDSDLYPNVDWRDLMLKSGAPSYYANINFSGGSDNVRYFVSGQYTSEDGRSYSFHWSMRTRAPHYIGCNISRIRINSSAPKASACMKIRLYFCGSLWR